MQVQKTIRLKIKKPVPDVFEPEIPSDILNMLKGKVIKKTMEFENIDVNKLMRLMEEKKSSINLTKFDDYVVESQSMKCMINHPFKLDVFGEIIKKIIANKSHSKIIGLDFNMEKYGKVKLRKKPKEKQSKRERKLYNQIAVNYDLGVNNRHIHIHFFHNGAITMVGCINHDDGIKAMDDIIETILKKHPEVFYNENHIEDIKMYNYATTMINSGFRMKFRINRDELYDIILNEYNMYVNFTNEKYAGVKISFMFNATKDGVCHCENKCALEQRRRKKNSCKIITIIVFSKGYTTITGGNSMEHVETAYKFITDVIRKCYNRLIVLDIGELVASLT